ncbi:hypothetical protein HZS_5432, partial [Henneguya salminicola]
MLNYDDKTNTEHRTCFNNLLKQMGSDANSKVREIVEDIYTKINNNNELFPSNIENSKTLKIPFKRLASVNNLENIQPRRNFRSQRNSPEKTKIIKKSLSSENFKTNELSPILPEDLVRMWDDIVPTKSNSFKDISKELNEIREGLAKINLDWTKRAIFIKKLRGIFAKFSKIYLNDLTIELDHFSQAFFVTIKDIRSKIHIEIFATLRYQFLNLIKPSVSSASSCLDLIFKYCTHVKIIPVLKNHLQNNKSGPVR